jgi:FMN-dependent NADH-azoreductase
MRIQNLELTPNEIVTNEENSDENSSLESFLAMPFFDINFGENIIVENIKLDMEDEKNQEACAKFLQNIEKMQMIFQLEPICRLYR